MVVVVVAAIKGLFFAADEWGRFFLRGGGGVTSRVGDIWLVCKN